MLFRSPSSRSEGDGRDAEEERRLMYVAITRAERELYLTRSKSRYLYGRRDLTAPSKFIKELAGELGIQLSHHVEKPRLQSYDGGGYQSYDDSGYQSDIPHGVVAFRPSTSQFAQPRPSGDKSYAVGQRVMHKKFGVGMIIAIKNGGTVLNVAFDGQGIKELSASLAPLEII